MRRGSLRTVLAISAAVATTAPGLALAEGPARTCDAGADRKLVRALADETERARLSSSRGGRDAEAEATLRGVVNRAAASAAVRCFPPAEVALARVLEKKAGGDPAGLRDAIALLVGVREIDPAGFPPEWRAAVADAGSKTDELVRRSLDAGRARLDAKDFAGAQAVARGLRQLFVDAKGGAGAFAGATALLSRATWRAGERAEARRVGRELEALSVDGLDRATVDDVNEARDELRALPRLVIRVHGPEGVALPVTLDGDPVEPGVPVRVEPGVDHRVLVDVPGYTRVDEVVRPTGPEELVERVVLEALAPAPPGSSSDDEASFARGLAAFEEKRWLDAAAAFESVRPSASRTYDLARAEEERGVPVRAFALFQAVIAEPSATPAWLAGHARRHADRARAAVGRVRVDLAAARATVTVDGLPIGPVSVGGARLYAPGAAPDGAPLPGSFELLVERGRRVFRVAEPGREPAQTEVDVGESGIVALRGGDAPASPLRRSIGIGATVAGGVGFVLGAGLGIAAINTIDDAKADPKLCPNKQCTPAGLDKVATARGEAWGSTLSFAFGVPLLVTGLVLWSPWSPGPKDAPSPAAPKAGFTPVVAPGFGGVSFGGSFQ